MGPIGLPPVNAPLPWQGGPWSDLSQQLDRDQLPHALLLAGPRYTGKAHFALALARLLLCHSPADSMNCGTCHACELSASGNHGDMRWLAPEEKSRVIKIDQVREVVEFANKTASFGQRKVIVLTPADSMNNNAANALLKSLEEPASDTFLILVCHRLHGVPATIRSRCQIRKLGIPAQSESLDWLDRLTGDHTESKRLLDLAEGRPLLAESLYREGGADTLAAQQLAFRGLLEGRVNVSEMAALLADDGIEQVLVRLAAGLESALRGFDGRELAGEQARGVFRVLDEITGIRRAVAGGANPNRQLLVEALLVKVQRLSSYSGV
jgi:DNA polymerase-3 subunit delta'